jgi:hypothetical protein
MRGFRSMTSIAVTVALAVAQLSVVTSTASAQGWDGRHGGRQHAPAARPTPKPAPVFAHRPAGPRFVAAPPAPRYVPGPSRPHFGGGHYPRPEYRGGHHGGHHNGGRVAAGVALGVGALIIGSAIASSSVHASSRSSDYERCASRFDSFDWDSGTIENEYGDRVVCPYLD